MMEEELVANDMATREPPAVSPPPDPISSTIPPPPPPRTKPRLEEFKYGTERFPAVPPTITPCSSAFDLTVSLISTMIDSGKNDMALNFMIDNKVPGLFFPWLLAAPPYQVSFDSANTASTFNVCSPRGMWSGVASQCRRTIVCYDHGRLRRWRGIYSAVAKLRRHARHVIISRDLGHSASALFPAHGRLMAPAQTASSWGAAGLAPIA